ncbi:transporter [Balneolaceae bacterium YR4-1]|uniref:Transporter n=1 Tax=Halalkalibaculum roseum TaxID=2709311 RepID=A0A6M1SQW2_9BACT|nr:transporter [Halalkalibaculum roseum]NGP77791.1 transporter [Halalkalibaculum roseum]
MSTSRNMFCLLFLLIFAASAPLMAQDNISPDRPGIGDGSYIVEPKVTYLEIGVEYFTVNDLNQYSLGQLVFRNGLLSGVELRMLLNSFVVQSFPSTDFTGVPDPGVGLKFKLFDRPGSNLRLSGLTTLSIPVGSTDFTTDEWIPSAALLADYSLTDYAGISANLGYTFDVGPFPDVWKVTLTPGYALPGDSNIGIYGGYAGFYSEGVNEHYIEAGFTKHVKSFLQLDLNAGLDVESQGTFIGGGLALQL